jgi:mannan endo-1,4-beta-mannosidase
MKNVSLLSAIPRRILSPRSGLLAAAVGLIIACSARGASNGVNLQPSYYNNGNVNFGWSLMNANTKIKTVRIEIEPGKETQARTWISQARSNGKLVIATYHKSSVLGSDSTSELTGGGNWWKANYGSLSSAGSIQVNLMNEWGSHNISSNSYASAYNTAISLVRSVYSSNIVVDIPGWGQETLTATQATTGANGTRLNDTNITLSAHVYPGAWNGAAGHTLNSTDLNNMGAGSGRSCMLGEFGSGSGSADWSGMVDNCRNNGWSVLGWAWNGDGGSLNMVTPSWASNPTATSFSASGYFSTVYNKL